MIASDYQKTKRAEDARFIVNGASNPVAVCGTIHKHMLAMSWEGADHPTIKADPAIRLMLDHLCQIMGGFGGLETGKDETDWSGCYRAVCSFKG